jgi:hypothetical protein
MAQPELSVFAFDLLSDLCGYSLRSLRLKLFLPSVENF